jgi:hypothetical protein
MPSIRPITEFLREEIKGNALEALFAVGAAVMTAVVLAIWSALKGHTGPQIATYSLVALAAVLVIAVAFAYLAKQGWLSSPVVKRSVGVVALIVTLLIARWLSGVITEISELRASQKAPTVIVQESPNDELRDEIRVKDDEIRAKNSEIVELKRNRDRLERDAATTNARVRELERKIRDLESILNERARWRKLADALGPLIRDGNMLLARCVREDCSKDVEVAAGVWNARVLGYVEPIRTSQLSNAIYSTIRPTGAGRPPRISDQPRMAANAHSEQARSIAAVYSRGRESSIGSVRRDAERAIVSSIERPTRYWTTRGGDADMCYQILDI